MRTTPCSAPSSTSCSTLRSSRPRRPARWHVAEDPLARRQALETALAHADTALARLTQAIAEGGAVPTLLQAIRDQERRHHTLRSELADLDRPRVVPLNVGQLKALLRTKAEEWQALLRKHAPIARQIVRKLIEGRIEFTPDREARRYTFRVAGTLANSFSGMVCPHAMASPICASWNRLCGWLTAVDGLRRAA